MRISDWISDVFSSDLTALEIELFNFVLPVTQKGSHSAKAIANKALDTEFWLPRGQTLVINEPVKVAAEIETENGRESGRVSVCKYVQIEAVDESIKKTRKNIIA